jgi:hypothetical protein
MSPITAIAAIYARVGSASLWALSPLSLRAADRKRSDHNRSAKNGPGALGRAPGPWGMLCNASRGGRDGCFDNAARGGWFPVGMTVGNDNGVAGTRVPNACFNRASHRLL